MEYLILTGRDLKSSMAGTLGDFSPFFWSVVAPIGLAFLWLGSIYALWETWIRGGSEPTSGAHLFSKLVFSIFMIAVLLASGTALEYLVLGHGVAHAPILGAFVDLARPR